MTRITTTPIAALLAVAVSTGGALAAGQHGHGHGGDIGKPAKASAATRTITVVMHDSYYEPERLEIREGETVRFVIRNEGTLVHEFNIGTAEMHAAHSSEMQMMVDHGVLKASSIDREAAKQMQKTMGHGMHDEPNSVLLEPGKTGEITWTFPAHATLEFACNVPGHYDAGMAGAIELTH